PEEIPKRIRRAEGAVEAEYVLTELETEFDMANNRWCLWRGCSRSRLFLPALIVVAAFFCCVQSGYASADSFLDGQMKLVESQIKHWESMSYFLGSLTLAVFICGVVVGLLQPGATKGKKIVAGVLAFTSAVIVAFTHTFFQADDRAYDKVAAQARLKLKNFAYQLALYPALDDATKAGLEKKFGDLQNEIDQLEYTTLHNAASISSQATRQGSILISSAWADQGVETTSHAPA